MKVHPSNELFKFLKIIQHVYNYQNNVDQKIFGKHLYGYLWMFAHESSPKQSAELEAKKPGLLSRILKSLIKVGYPSRFKPDFLQVDSPCSCGHFEMRLTYVGLLVPKL